MLFWFLVLVIRHRHSGGLQCSIVPPCVPIFSAPTLGVFSNESILLPLPPFSFSLMTGCPGDSGSWPCLHQVRCISLYFVFHQLWLHKTPLISGDYCQKLQSPICGLICLFYPPQPSLYTCPLTSTCWKQGVSIVPGMVLILLSMVFVSLAGHLSGSQFPIYRLAWIW